MNSTVLAIRAITSQYAAQLLWPLLWIGVAVYALIMALIIWLAMAVSPWWLLLAFVPTIIIIAAAVVWTTAWVLSRRLAPPMNRKQKTAAKKFVGRINSVAENIGMPRFVLVFRIIKDVVTRPSSGQTFIGELSQTPGDMKREFDELRKLF
jgi:membrane protein implicated in regulation of membrane protease activity